MFAFPGRVFLPSPISLAFLRLASSTAQNSRKSVSFALSFHFACILVSFLLCRRDLASLHRHHGRSFLFRAKSLALFYCLAKYRVLGVLSRKTDRCSSSGHAVELCAASRSTVEGKKKCRREEANRGASCATILLQLSQSCFAGLPCLAVLRFSFCRSALFMCDLASPFNSL